MSSPVIVWFRQDLRIQDNPALFFASQQHAPVILLYIHDTHSHAWQLGAASQWYLRESLISLDRDLRSLLDTNLILQKGDPCEVLLAVAKKTKASAIFWNRCYEPFHIARDKKIKETLDKNDIKVNSFNGALLKEPWEILNLSKEPFKVFTPFWKKLKTMEIREIVSAPKKISSRHFESKTIDELYPLPTINWYQGLKEAWKPGEKVAKNKLAHFLKHALSDYQNLRNHPFAPYTSELSPCLHFGEISPVQIWHATLTVREKHPNIGNQVDCFLSEIAWREFSYHQLFHYPHLPIKPIKEKFNDYPWKKKQKWISQWQKGMTGYPIVDAGMRQLWHTGWMHNRVRMIVASFLIKHLNQPWQVGEQWFWDTLVDADLANNAASWQWVAGCGMDAAPFFRIFNPTLQGEKFDNDGEYVKKWVPELLALSSQYVHKPWEAPEHVLQKAKVILGETYPLPIVDHNTARLAALAAYKKIK